MTEQFKVGDVVRLKSGGPAMTIKGYCIGDNDKWWCVWFNFNTSKMDLMDFPAGCLMYQPEEEEKK